MERYKAELTEARSELEKMDEKFRSFKDRVAENVMLSLKTDNTENMDSPVNQSRLTEMYQQLRVCTWPDINFPSSERKAGKLVKVERFKEKAVENLQLSLFYSSKAEVFKAAGLRIPNNPAEFQLASECYWLGCLMALHIPPLHPDWINDNNKPFPRNIRH
ncbi:hypothetical protein WMY93_034174 [Mugilogobius chulae]|uniref:Uncharacterized protein n=1 Tax=Mugilogobius chulae TaxID=88201 RepID=A0AAW0MQC7_9GOBI